MLTVDGLSRSFGRVKAVHDVTFQLAAGEIVALAGPSGAGKTTLLDLIGGQRRAHRGRLRLGDDDVTRAGPGAIARLGVGRMFQNSAGFGSMTVRENLQTAIVAARGELAGWWRPIRRRHRSRADHLLDRVGLLDHAERWAGCLTPAEHRRLDLALAMAHRPRLLLLDAPTADLQPAEADALMSLVFALARGDETAILYSEHDSDPVVRYTERVLVMEHGALIADKRSAETTATLP